MTDDLLALTEELCAIPSVSGTEAALADVVEARLRDDAADRCGSSGSAPTSSPAPSSGRDAADRARRPSRHRSRQRQRRRPRRDGDVLHGLGTADMKGGLAVLLALADDLADGAGPVRRHARVLRGRRGRRRAQRAAAPVRGVARARAGRSRDPARADRRLGRGRLSGHDPRARDLRRRARRTRPGRGWGRTRSTGPRRCSSAARSSTPRPSTSTRSSTARRCRSVRIEGGIANNVVPDRCAVVINRRYAPSRSLEDAVDEVVDVLHRRRRRPRRGAERVDGRAAEPHEPADRGDDRRLRPAGAAEAGLDRRRPLRRARDPGVQLRAR